MTIFEDRENIILSLEQRLSIKFLAYYREFLLRANRKVNHILVSMLRK